MTFGLHTAKHVFPSLEWEILFYIYILFCKFMVVPLLLPLEEASPPPQKVFFLSISLTVSVQKMLQH